MKAFLLCALILATALPVFGQYSARTLTRKVVPQQPPPPVQPQRAAPAPAPGASAAQPAAKPADPAKAQAEKTKNEGKQLEYFKKRAEEGSDHAQYELGMRYLTGKGTAVNEKLGREWIEKSAKKGNTQAVKKLAELGPAPKTEVAKTPVPAAK